MVKKTGKRISKGIHSSVRRATVMHVKVERTPSERYELKYLAWTKGHNPKVSLLNPKDDTSRRHVRVSMNDIMGGSYRETQGRERKARDQSSTPRLQESPPA